MTTEVVHEPAASRYVLLVDGEEAGVAHYSVREDEILITGTAIDPARQGGGLGQLMVRAVIDDIIATTDKKITSACWFVTKWLDLHPDYVDKARSGGVDAELGHTCRII